MSFEWFPGIDSLISIMPWLLLVILLLPAILILTSPRASSRKLLALILHVSFTACLTLSLYRPLLETEQTSIRVATEGVSGDILQELIQSASEFSPLYLEQSLFKQQSFKFTPRHIHAFTRASDLPAAMEGIELYGNGLKAGQLDRGVFIADWQMPLLSGITRLEWSRTLHLGEPMQINGQATLEAEATLKLVTPNSETISIELNDAGEFSITHWPSALGPQEYMLEVVSGDAILQEERLTLDVKPPARIKTLIIADAPSFEWSQLQRFLESQQHPLVSQLKISRDRYRLSYSELTEEDFTLNEGQIASDDWSLFDLIIMDIETYTGLTPSQQSQLDELVSDGLGLIIRRDEIDPLLFADYDSISAEVLPEDERLSEVQVLNREQAEGQVIQTDLASSYQLWMSGDQKAYVSLWQSLVKRAARTDKQAASISIEPQLVTEGELSKFCLLGVESDRQLQLSNAEKASTLDLVPLSDMSRCTSHYFESSGWHILENEDVARSFYVYKTADFFTVRSAERQIATSDASSISGVTSEVTQRRPMSTFPLLLLSLLLLGAVYAEQKFLK